MNTAKTILVIDDDKKFSFGLIGVLRREGFQVISAMNGAEGMAAIRAEKPDMILCDVMMPPPNGIQLKRDLANDAQLSQIPFLFLSARISQVDKLAGLKSGADDYITKPFDVNELLARIESVLRRDECGHLRGVQESLADLNSLRNSISTQISHEARTPLTIILSTLEVILKEKFTRDDTNLERYINTANSSAYRLKFLIEDLEMLYEIDKGKPAFLAQRIDITFHLKDAIEQTLEMWKRKQLNIQFEIDRETVIYAPQNKFAHIVAHLVDNACKYSPENGRVVISIQSNAARGYYLEITNEGLGIPVELREKVFERYYQINRSDTREFGGLGVGLTLARAYARAWGGDVQILDSPSGCRVRMVLPPYKVD